MARPALHAFVAPASVLRARTRSTLVSARVGARRFAMTAAPQARSEAETKSQSGGGGGGKKTKAKDVSNVVANLEITPRSEDYSQWYQDVIYSSELADTSPVKGCLVFRPHGFEIWERLRDELDKRIKATGAKNAYFPLLIPQSFLSREAEHVDGFSKECAVVTHHRLRGTADDSTKLEPDPDAKLEEPLVIRPTSETIIWHMFERWIESYRQLPLAINQWANVVRWEMRTRPFLRTAEFLWQEGHTAHATAEEADERAKLMIGVYQQVAAQFLAIPVVVGVKTEHERFPGGVTTYTIEALMQNGWALQAATSHFLGETFAKAFDVKFKDADGDEKFVWATSWGMTTRMLGALIMTHSDDTGLVLPPKVAPIQVVLVFIFKNDSEFELVSNHAKNVAERLRAIGIRVEVDDRPNMRPGAKYYEWERKGVPLRLEIGPKDAKKNAVFAARRTGGKKVSIQVDAEGVGFEDTIENTLQSIHDELYELANTRIGMRTAYPETYDEMKQILTQGGDNLGFIYVPWKDSTQNEIKVKEETKATIRCYAVHNQDMVQGKTCIYSGEPATHIALFARAF